MTKIYYDDDVDMKILYDLKIGIVGYGNQGRAQALNIRDSGYKPIVANRDNEYKDKAVEVGLRIKVLKGTQFRKKNGEMGTQKDGFILHAVRRIYRVFGNG